MHARFGPVLAALVFGFFLTACGGDPVEEVKAARMNVAPDTTIGKAFGSYRYFKNVVWEPYKSESGEQMVRASCEYEVKTALADCAQGPAGEAPAARVFLSVLFAMVDGKAVVKGAAFQTYSAKGYYEEYPAHPEAVEAVLAGKSSAACEYLFLPSYL
jgi:hypothetical protein